MKRASKLVVSCLIILPLIIFISCNATSQNKDSLNKNSIEIEKVSTGKKILVVYFSKTGNTERVAKDIAGALNAHIEKLIDKKERSGCLSWFLSGRDGMNENTTGIEFAKIDASRYDIVIIGSPVWGWNMTPVIREYIEQNRLKFRNVAFFITAGGTTIDKILPYMERVSGKKAFSSLGFVTKELNNPDIYKTKINDFVKTFNNLNKQ